MLTTWIPIGLGFIEGFALILSPCILPVLPLILAGSLSGGQRRVFGIITGFVFCFAMLAFGSRQLVLYTGIDLNVLRLWSFVLLALLGLILLSTTLTNAFNQLLHRGLSIFFKSTHPLPPGGGFFRGFILGGLISIVWTPCAGPILAAVIVSIATQRSNFISFCTLLAFALGAALPMFMIAIWSKQLINTMGWFSARAVLFRRLLGGIILASVGYLVWQEHSPLLMLNQSSMPVSAVATKLEQGLWRPYQAPSIQTEGLWFNSKPLNQAALKGHVVLIDFWTYSCINCLRTLPEIRHLYKKYKDQGLVVIGVHAPEFAFEKKPENVKQALQRYGIDYPVVLDNQFEIWQSFANHYWPAQYLIDQSGNVVYQHVGEGGASTLENNIRFLLKLHKPLMRTAEKSPTEMSPQTPETYLGYARSDVDTGNKIWSLSGSWQVKADFIVAKAPEAAIQLHFYAGQVYAVMGATQEKPVSVQVLLNGKPIRAVEAGDDVKEGRVFVNAHKLYHLVALKQANPGVIKLISESAGLSLYTFTFGG